MTERDFISQMLCPIWIICLSGRVLAGWIPRELVQKSISDRNIFYQSFRIILAEKQISKEELTLCDIWAYYIMVKSGASNN